MAQSYTNLEQLITQSLYYAPDNSPFMRFMRKHRWYDPRILLKIIPYIRTMDCFDFLVWACQRGILIAVQKILEKQPHLLRGGDDEPFEQACIHGHLHIIEYIMEICPAIHERKNDLLLWACQNGHLNIIKYLVVQVGVPVNTSALIQACKYGYLDIVKYIVEGKLMTNTGEDTAIDMIYAQENRALSWACGNGHLDVVKYLIDVIKKRVGNDAIQTCCNVGITWAYLQYRLPVIQYLVEQGVDIHIYNDYGFTLSCIYGYVDTVKYIVETVEKKEGLIKVFEMISKHDSYHQKILPYIMEIKKR